MYKLEDLHILIAEDDQDDGEFIEQSFLRHAAFTKVSWVKNGKMLLTFLKSIEHLPDLILTDINMPIINGMEAVATLLKDPDFCHIPSFVYSSTVNPSYGIKAKELGCEAFLVKPFSLNDFEKVPQQVIEILQRKE